MSGLRAGYHPQSCPEIPMEIVEVLSVNTMGIELTNDG